VEELVGSSSNPYLGGLAGAVPPLLPSAEGAMAELLLPSAGGVMAGAGAGAGAAAGGVVVSVLLQADSTNAAARALRASFVFIDESPELYEVGKPNKSSANQFVGRVRLPKRRFYRYSTLF
jgi:hypothetical protein